MPTSRTCVFVFVSSQLAVGRERLPQVTFGKIASDFGGGFLVFCEDRKLHRFSTDEVQVIPENKVPVAFREALSEFVSEYAPNNTPVEVVCQSCGRTQTVQAELNRGFSTCRYCSGSPDAERALLERFKELHWKRRTADYELTAERELTADEHREYLDLREALGGAEKAQQKLSLLFDRHRPAQDVSKLGMKKDRILSVSLKELKRAERLTKRQVRLPKPVSLKDRRLIVAELLAVPRLADGLTVGEYELIRLRILEGKSVREVEQLCDVSKSDVDRKTDLAIAKLARWGRAAVDDWAGPMPKQLAVFAAALRSMEEGLVHSFWADDCGRDFNVGFNELHFTKTENWRVDFDDYSHNSKP